MAGLPSPTPPSRFGFATRPRVGEPDDGARRRQWGELFLQLYGPIQFQFAHRPFAASLQMQRHGGVGITSCHSSIERFIRAPECVTAVGSDDFHLVINRGSKPLGVRHAGKHVTLDPGAMTLVNDEMPGEIAPGANNGWALMRLPRKRLLETAGNVEEVLAHALGSSSAASEHLRHYVDLLLDRPPANDEQLGEHVATTLLDLVSLTLGPRRGAEGVLGARGTRAARLESALLCIARNFHRQDFSVSHVAEELGCSVRHVQDLLASAGGSFSRRVLDLRLRRVYEQLCDPRSDQRAIGDLARAAGFGDVCHFSRTFRARYGASASDLRVEQRRR